MRFLNLAVLLMIGSVLGAQTPAPQGNAVPKGDAANGKKIFASYGCYQCHGYEGQGGVGVRLAPKPMSYPAFAKYIRHPTREMPPYTEKVVTDQELADIYAYLLAIPAPPPASSLPQLSN
jgi:ubiquinol-cytochrome c reductase cytochrome c subunit